LILILFIYLFIDVVVKRLYSAIAYGEDLLSALINPDTVESSEAICLRNYIMIVRSVLTVSLPTDKSTLGLTQLLVGIPIEEWKLIAKKEIPIQSNEEVAVLQLAANTIYNLIDKEQAPMR
jgi:hypothetical protein